MNTKTKSGWVAVAVVALLMAAPMVAQADDRTGTSNGASGSSQSSSSRASTADDDAARRRSADSQLSHFKDGAPPRSVSERSDKDERKSSNDDTGRNAGRGTGYRSGGSSDSGR